MQIYDLIGFSGIGVLVVGVLIVIKVGLDPNPQDRHMHAAAACFIVGLLLTWVAAAIQAASQ